MAPLEPPFPAAATGITRPERVGAAAPHANICALQATNEAKASTLMGLPAELREMIWLFVVQEEEPLVAYLERRTIARPKEQRKPHLPVLIHQTRRQPQSPALCAVSVAIRHVSLPLYYSGNIFAFTFSQEWAQDVQFEVQKWQACSPPLYPARGTSAGRPSARMQLFSLWTVRLEFSLIPLTNPPCSATAGLHRPATIDISSSHVHDLKDDDLNLQMGGQIADECTCWLRRQCQFRFCGGILGTESAVGAGASTVERWWREHSRSLGRRKASGTCEGCGKLVLAGVDPGHRGTYYGKVLPVRQNWA